MEGSFVLLTQQIKAVHKDLLAFETKTEQRFKTVDQRFDRLENKVDAMDVKIDGFAKALHGIVRDTVYEANRARQEALASTMRNGIE